MKGSFDQLHAGVNFKVLAHLLKLAKKFLNKIFSGLKKNTY